MSSTNNTTRESRQRRSELGPGCEWSANGSPNARLAVVTTNAADALFRQEFEQRARARFALSQASVAHTPFLRSLLSETLAESLERAGADPALLSIGPLFELQLQAQSSGYAQAYPAAQHYIVSRREDGDPIGRMLIDWAPTSTSAPVTLVDIAVRPSARAGAAGLHLLRACVASCDLLARAVKLHVVPDNPARRLYQHLGFLVTDATAFPLPMRREPRPAP
jgi:ribosomal protein S18 acetylase RimI-like enzyme